MNYLVNIHSIKPMITEVYFYQDTIYIYSRTETMKYQNTKI